MPLLPHYLLPFVPQAFNFIRVWALFFAFSSAVGNGVERFRRFSSIFRRFPLNFWIRTTDGLDFLFSPDIWWVVRISRRLHNFISNWASFPSPWAASDSYRLFGFDKTPARPSYDFLHFMAPLSKCRIFPNCRTKKSGSNVRFWNDFTIFWLFCVCGSERFGSPILTTSSLVFCRRFGGAAFLQKRIHHESGRQRGANGRGIRPSNNGLAEGWVDAVENSPKSNDPAVESTRNCEFPNMYYFLSCFLIENR